MTEGTIEQLYSGLADGDRQQLVSELVTSLGEDTKANVGGHPSQLAQIIEPQEEETGFAQLSDITKPLSDVKLATRFVAAGIGAASGSAISEIVLSYIPAQRDFQLAGIGMSTIIQMALGLIGYHYAPKISGAAGQYIQAAAGGVAINAGADIARIFGILYKGSNNNNGSHGSHTYGRSNSAAGMTG